MGSKESPQEDVIEKVTFDLNILVCGNYVEENIKKDLKSIDKASNKPYLKNGIHKYIKNWNYYLFGQDNKIGDNTFKFIEESITQKKNYKNLILFFTGLNNFKYQDLIDFYDKKAEIYQSHILIITEGNEILSFEDLKPRKLNKNLIKIIEADKKLDICIHLIHVSAYYNQLGDEIGFPKNIIDIELLDKDNELMIKYSFTFNILLCGRPGCGKSTLINKILGKKKAYARKGDSTLTFRIVKYISDRNPIVFYDTPGIKEDKKGFEKIQKLIKQKNESLNEEKEKIHCVFYVLNAKAERTFNIEEFDFLKFILEQNLDIYFIVTHAETEENVNDFIGAIKVNLAQNANIDKRIIELKDKIYPVELEEKGNYTQFGIKKIFTTLHNKYKNYKFLEDIKPNNIQLITSSIFLGDIKTKEDLKKKLTALSLRAKANFKILASSLGDSPSVKGTSNLSTAAIKVISKIYNHSILTNECLQYIQSKGFTDEYHGSDNFIRTIEKILESIFYPNGPAAKEVESLASKLINEYNSELNEDKNFYGLLNNYNRSINYAIDCLEKIND